MGSFNPSHPLFSFHGFLSGKMHASRFRRSVTRNHQTIHGDNCMNSPIMKPQKKINKMWVTQCNTYLETMDDMGHLKVGAALHLFFGGMMP